MPGLRDNASNVLSARHSAINHVYYGPQRLSLPALGLSVYVPSGWIAGINQGELYGLGPVGQTGQASSPGRIYVTDMTGDFSAMQQSLTNTIDLTCMKLEPASPLIIELKLASARFSVTGHPLFRQACVSAISVSDNRNLLFIALNNTAISSQLKTVTHDLAGSVKSMRSTVTPFPGGTASIKPVPA